MSDRIRNRNHLRWVGASYFSFSLAASGWLHLRLHGIKKKKKIFSCFFWWRTKPSASSSTRQLHPLGVSARRSSRYSPHSLPIISASLCRARSLLYISKISCVSKACVLWESRIFASAVMEKHHMVTESNIHNCYCLLILTKKDTNACKC